MSGASRLHHVGFVVVSIAAAGEPFARSFGATWDGKVIHDPIQQARVTFFETNAGDPLIELVEPDAQNSPINRFLEKNGGGLHHLCYEVANLGAHLEKIRAGGALVVRQPVPAAAFEGRRIAWVYTKQRVLLEYLEA